MKNKKLIIELYQKETPPQFSFKLLIIKVNFKRQYNI